MQLILFTLSAYDSQAADCRLAPRQDNPIARIVVINCSCVAIRPAHQVFFKSIHRHLSAKPCQVTRYRAPPRIRSSFSLRPQSYQNQM